MKKIIIVIFSFATFFFSCRKDKVEDSQGISEDCPELVSYTSNIQTFLTLNCSTSGCHNANSNAAGYVFETYAQAEEHADIILSVIRHESGVSAMPQGGPKLADSTIRKMNCWINQGKLFN